MTKEKRLEIRRESGESEVLRYYWERRENREFGCEVYAVGIERGRVRREIESFSPDEAEARELVGRLYENSVQPEQLYSRAEEFIVTM
ncbi:MAG: DUF6514 family protein [Clostridia bacterium]|nr:DUF6514 family protein [Clostridia bacterium]